MTWVLFVVTMLSGGAVQIEGQRFDDAMTCREAAAIAMALRADEIAVAVCERRREVDA